MIANRPQRPLGSFGSFPQASWGLQSSPGGSPEIPPAHAPRQERPLGVPPGASSLAVNQRCFVAQHGPWAVGTTFCTGTSASPRSHERGHTAEGGGGGQSPEILLLSWQLAASIGLSPLTKIHQEGGGVARRGHHVRTMHNY